MIPVSAAYTRCFFPCFSVGNSSSTSASSSSPPSPVVVVKNPRAGVGSVSLNLGPGAAPVGFSGPGRGQTWNSSWWCCGFVRRGTGESDVEGDSELEAKVLEFMRTSGNPGAFPTEKQLIDAGREDLAVAISEQGGWLAMGWKSDEDDGRRWNSEFGDWEYRGNGVLRTVDSVEESDDLDFHEVRSSGFSSSAADSSNSTSNSGRSLKTTNEDDYGVDGILKRLEKERNISFGVGLKRKGNSPKLQSNSAQNERAADLKKNNKGSDDSVHVVDQSRSLSNSDGLPAWKAWSYQRAASSIEKLEASEVLLQEPRMGRIRDGSRESLGGKEETNLNEIQSSIGCLDLELSYVLVSLKSKANAVLVEEDHQSKPEVLRTLSDAWEFHENKIMKARERLRSIRAKLAVLDGKVALAIIDSKKIADRKQKRIDDARKALQFLRTAYITWTKSGSEVLLLGSYDGWTSKRKMKKTSSGIFTLYLKLYPGTYEIKFLVDGEWKIDPLRPTVRYSGHENNQLVIE